MREIQRESIFQTTLWTNRLREKEGRRGIMIEREREKQREHRADFKTASEIKDKYNVREKGRERGERETERKRRGEREGEGERETKWHKMIKPDIKEDMIKKDRQKK